MPSLKELMETFEATHPKGTYEEFKLWCKAIASIQDL